MIAFEDEAANAAHHQRGERNQKLVHLRPDIELLLPVLVRQRNADGLDILNRVDNLADIMQHYDRKYYRRIKAQ